MVWGASPKANTSHALVLFLRFDTNLNYENSHWRISEIINVQNRNMFRADSWDIGGDVAGHPKHRSHLLWGRLLRPIWEPYRAIIWWGNFDKSLTFSYPYVVRQLIPPYELYRPFLWLVFLLEVKWRHIHLKKKKKKKKRGVFGVNGNTYLLRSWGDGVSETLNVLIWWPEVLLFVLFWPTPRFWWFYWFYEKKHSAVDAPCFGMRASSVVCRAVAQTHAMQVAVYAWAFFPGLPCINEVVHPAGPVP